MARVTVEDCVSVVPNRYELVLLAAQRARDISAGVQETVERDNDKNAVIALREIADQTIDMDELRRHITRGVNRHADMTFEDDELLALAEQSVAQVEAETSEGAAEIEEISFEEVGVESDDSDEDDEPSLEDLQELANEGGDLDDTQVNV